MTQDIYNRIMDQLGGFIEDAYDQKLPDVNDDGTPWVLTDTPVIVTSGISDVPTSSIDGVIVLRDQRLTCEIQALNLSDARDIKEMLIKALNGWRGQVTGICLFENGGPELFDAELNPPRYCLPVDFMVMI